MPREGRCPAGKISGGGGGGGGIVQDGKCPWRKTSVLLTNVFTKECIPSQAYECPARMLDQECISSYLHYSNRGIKKSSPTARPLILSQVFECPASLLD